MLTREMLDTLQRARALLSEKQRWTFAAMARDASGIGVYAEDPDACCWCALGALRREAEEHCFPEEVVEGCIDVLESVLPGDWRRLVRFNDGTSHDDVVALFDRAIARLEAA